MNRRHLACLLGALLLAAVLTACGDDDGGTADATAEPPETTEAADDESDDEDEDEDESSSADESLWIVSADTDELFQVDPANGEVLATVDVESFPTDVVVGHDAVWVANAQAGTVSRVDPETAEVEETIETEDARGLFAGEDQIWVSRIDVPSIVAIDPETNEVTEEIPLSEDEQDPEDLVELDDGTLIAEESFAAGLLQVDPDEGVVNELDAEVITDMVLEDDSLLVAHIDGILDVDPESLSINEELATEDRPWAIAVDEEDPDIVWVAFQTFPGTVQALDRTTGELEGTPIELGEGQPYDAELVDGILWVVDEDGQLHRVDPETEEVETFDLPADPGSAAMAAG
jgi:streptogramin lyase